MTVKTRDAARGERPTGRAPGGGQVGAGTGEQLSRADRVARGKTPGQRFRWSRTRSSGRIGRGIRSGCRNLTLV